MATGKQVFSCSACSFSRLTSNSTGADNATRCASFAFIRLAGTVQTPNFRSNSSNIAPRTPPLRAAVRLRKSRAAARGFALLECRDACVAPRHRGLVLLLGILLRQGLGEHADGVRENMGMRPSPLHDRVHMLSNFARCFRLFQPDRAHTSAQSAGAIASRFFAPSYAKKRNPPANESNRSGDFRFATSVSTLRNSARRLFEGERGGRN